MRAESISRKYRINLFREHGMDPLGERSQVRLQNVKLRVSGTEGQGKKVEHNVPPIQAAKPALAIEQATKQWPLPQP